MTTLDEWTPATEQLPTLLGKVDGIVSFDPLILQCRTCGATYTSNAPAGMSRNMAIILSGSGFHRCGPEVGRLCRACLTAAHDTCDRRSH